MGEGRGTEGGWWFKQQKPLGSASVILPRQFRLCTTHAACCSPSFFYFSLFSLQCWPNNCHVQFWPPSFAHSQQVSFESSTLALQQQHCLLASMGLPSWPRPQEPLFPLTRLKGALSAWQLQDKRKGSNRTLKIRHCRQRRESMWIMFSLLSVNVTIEIGNVFIRWFIRLMEFRVVVSRTSSCYETC